MSKNKSVVPGAKQGLNKFKTEVASELGIPMPTDGDMGNLTSRQNGSIGGEMVRKMIAASENSINNGQMPPKTTSSKNN